MPAGTVRLGLLGSLARACHPLPSAAVTAVIVALAISAGRGPGAAWVGLAVLTGQLSVGLSNDYIDRERDRERTGKPLAGDALPARLVAGTSVVALLACVPLSLASGWRAALVHLAGVAAAWSYNLGIKATVASWLPYVVGFGALPAFVTLGLPGHPWPAWWVPATGALLGAGAHFANVVPDISRDRADGVLGLPQRLGTAGSRVTATVLLVAASVVAALGPAGPVDPLGVAGLVTVVAVVLAGAAMAPRSGPRAAFYVSIVVAVLDVGLLVARGGHVT